MDTSNCGPAQGDEFAMDAADWRLHILPDSRRRVGDKIFETLKKHPHFPGQDRVEELKKIAVRFEEKIYTSATSQSDYLRKISLKMLTLEHKSQYTIANSLSSNSASSSKNPPDPVMDRYIWRPEQGGDPVTGDWRTQLQEVSRLRIVNKIMETLMRHLPFLEWRGYKN